MTNLTTSTSLFISGAGPVGLALALGLKSAPISITIIDQKPKPSVDDLLCDTRMMAVSAGSRNFLKELGIWGELVPYATPIKTVEVSERNVSSVIQMKAESYHLDSLGELIPLGRIVLALTKGLEGQSNVSYLAGARLTSFKSYDDHAICDVKYDEDVQRYKADWVVSAEGADSLLREWAGIETCYRDYNQSAVIATIMCEKPHNNCAYERFTTDGPLALLPIDTHKMAVVLTVPRDQQSFWQSASDEKFIYEIIERLDDRLGCLSEPSKRHVWPLRLMLPKELRHQRLILAGNSAHALHPIAGQGLNLGLRDVIKLISLFESGLMPDSCQIMEFGRSRKKDIIETVWATDFLVQGFGVKGLPAQLLRGAALFGVQFFPPLKHKIAKFGMGL